MGARPGLVLWGLDLKLSRGRDRGPWVGNAQRVNYGHSHHLWCEVRMSSYGPIEFFFVPADTAKESEPLLTWQAALAKACQVHERRRVPVDVWARQAGRLAVELVLTVEPERVRCFFPWTFLNWSMPASRQRAEQLLSGYGLDRRTRAGRMKALEG